MKKVKLFFAAVATIFAMNANAQFIADVRLGSVASAGGFGLNVGYEKPITEFQGCEFAWDVVNFEFAAPFNSPADLDMLSLKTGVRAFSPTFGNDKFRAYTNLAIGYTCVLNKWGDVGAAFDYADEVEDLLNAGNYAAAQAAAQAALDEIDDGGSMSAYHGFGLTWGIGVQYNKKFSLGFTLQWESKFKTKNYFATFGYTF